jgi:hypothetical protein
MAMRKICPDAVRGWRSRGSQTQPVPSIAACFAGSTRTAKTASAGAWMVLLALTVSLAIDEYLLSQACDPSKRELSVVAPAVR